MPNISVLADNEKTATILKKIRRLPLNYSEFDEKKLLDILIVDEKKLQASHLKKNFLPGNPEVLVWYSEKFKHWSRLANKHSPQVISEDADDDLIAETIKSALERRRKQHRLEALRNHQQRGWSFEQNPVLHIITNLIQECTQAESYPDILSSIATLKKVIGFQEATLILTDKSGRAINIFVQQGDTALPAGVHKKTILPTLQSPIIFNADTEATAPFHPFIVTPWSTGLLLQLDSTITLAKSNIPTHAHLLLLKHDLVPYSERELWVLEMALGPLILAFEKVIMFDTISKASKEWRSTFDAISEPITVIDENFNIVKANRSFSELVNFDIKKIKGKKCYALLAQRKVPCTACPALQGNQSFGSRITGKQRLDLLAWSYSIHTKKENYKFQFYRNVSKESSLTGKLVQAEKMAALGKLVGAIAHEINNPLAGILATAQLLSAEVEEADILDSVKEIQEAASRSKKIIDNLLGFTGNTVQNSEAVDINECISMALTFSKSALRDVKVHTKLEPNLKLTKSTNSSLQQVLFNLITNAAHAMNGKGEIFIRSSKETEKICIEVCDTGPGIPSEHLKVIFDPFHTTKAEGKGTGLGLSIVKNLVAKMDGQIIAKSKPGEGTSFSIYL